MRSAQTQSTAPTRSHRPRAITVFAAAFVAGAAAAVGVNQALDVRLAQSKPRVESEAIFVALRSLPQGAPVTVWDVALRDWPKAMMPASALRASDTFSGHVLKHPLREGQPLLSIQLAPTGQGAQPAAEPTTFPPPAAYTHANTPVVPCAEGDRWLPAEPVAAQATPSTQQLAPTAVSPAISPVAVQPVEATPPTASIAIAPSIESSIAAAPAATPTQLPTQDTVSPQEPSATTESAPIEPTATVAAADGPALVPDTTEATPAAEPVSAPSTVPQPQAGPEGTAAADVAPPPAPVAASDTAETVVAQPAPPVAPAPLAAVPPTPPSPVNITRPTHLRYLVVPESIATQADASFAARPVAPEQPVAEQPAAEPTQTASRSGSNAVRPLPSTTSADRSGQGRSSQRGPQGKTPQRQGRQAQPASPGTPSNAAPQPRLGAVMFPNLSAGISAIDGQIRGVQPAPAPAPGQGQGQGQGPIAAQARPLTVR